MINFKHYRVTIVNPGALDAPANGFIDPVSTELYHAQDDAVTDYEASVFKERGNVRWNRLIQKASDLVTPVITAISSDGEANTEPTEIAFTLVYDRPEYLSTMDELAPAGEAPVILEGADAVKRLLARGLCDTINSRRQLMSPLADSTVFSQDMLQLVAGPIADDVEAAEALITVEEIENV